MSWFLPRARRMFREGDFYVDCLNHPVLATEVRPVHIGVTWQRLVPLWRVVDWDLAGYSIVDGSYPRSTSQVHCHPEKVSPEEAFSRMKAYIK